MARIIIILEADGTKREDEFENWPKIQKHLAAEAFYFAYKDITDTKDKNLFKEKELEEKIRIIKNIL